MSATDSKLPCMFSPDGKWCLVVREFPSTGSREVQGFSLFDVETGESVGEYRCLHGVVGIRFAPSGTEVILTSYGAPRDVTIVSLPACKPRVRVELGVTDDVRDFAILPEQGEALVLCSENLKVC